MKLLKSSSLLLILPLLMLSAINNNKLNAQHNMKNVYDSTVTMTGYIQKEIILGKDQKRISYEDYYFQEKGSAERIFIKCSESKVENKVLDSLLNKKTDQLWVSEEVEITAVFKKGPWDGKDRMNTNVDLNTIPGRNGQYLIIQRISKTNEKGYTEFEGRIIKTPMFNKANRKLNVYDLFFVTGKEEYFIKINSHTVPRQELESLLIKKSEDNYESPVIKIKGEIKDGLWDTNDPTQQSRIGEYILIYEIGK